MSFKQVGTWSVLQFRRTLATLGAPEEAGGFKRKTDSGYYGIWIRQTQGWQACSQRWIFFYLAVVPIFMSAAASHLKDYIFQPLLELDGPCD